MAHPDLQALFDSLLQFTKKLLSEHGGFNPWGATMCSTGEIQWVGADNGEEFPDAQVLWTYARAPHANNVDAVGNTMPEAMKNV